MKPWQAALAVTLVAGVGWVLLVRGEQGTPASAKPARAAPIGSASPPGRPASGPLPSRAPAAALPAPSPAISAGLLAGFSQATDYRQFVLDAMKRPAEGGHFYARYALARCLGGDRAAIDHGVQQTVAQTGTVSPMQLEIGDRVVRRCASFGRGEASRMLSEVILQSRDGPDPLLQAERELQSAMRGEDREALRRATARLLELGDPLLLTEGPASLLHVASADPAARAADGFRFGDRIVANEDKPESLLAGMALVLGACREETPCGFDTVMEMQCTAHGFCQSDWMSGARALLAEGGLQPKEIERAFGYVARVRRAIDEKDTAFFVR